jgi:hypothetical protein
MDMSKEIYRRADKDHSDGRDVDGMQEEVVTADSAKKGVWKAK